MKATSADQAAAVADAAVEAARHKEAAAGNDATAAPRASLTVNTNLEQISDWLTKIIVGVSLVESQTLLVQMRHVAAFMAQSMAGERSVAAWMASKGAAAANAASAAASQATNLASFASVEPVAYAIMLYFLATGLLGSYLLTRLFLQRALDNAATGRSD
ncbi:MAG TPA: hypothetical protein VIN03_26025 [Roseateles sp.]